MRLYRYGIQPNIGATGEATHITVWFENRDDMTGDIMNGNFIASMDDFVRIQNKEITTEDIIKQKITKMLDLNADADTELAIQEVREKVDEVNTQAVKAIEEKAEHIMTTVTMKAEEITKQAQVAIETQVQSIRKAVKSLVKIDELAPDDIADLVALYEPWEEGESLAVGDIRSYDGKLWEVIQEHTTQAEWTPPTVPALFKEIAPAQTEDGEEIVPEWNKPTGEHDAYNTGDKVLFDGKVYESVIDANTWSPTDYPQGWSVIE